jgi:hypothetical protein
MRLLGRGVYRCTVCGEVVRTAESDTLPVMEFTRCRGTSLPLVRRDGRGHRAAAFTELDGPRPVRPIVAAGEVVPARR